VVGHKLVDSLADLILAELVQSSLNLGAQASRVSLVEGAVTNVSSRLEIC
jgi:hypothetical protein